MAAFTVSIDRNFHDSFFSTRAGADTYTVDSGATLTIDCDSRYGPNTTTTTGSPASFTISSTTGGKIKFDASNVWLIPYNSGSGNVPAADTTITQSGQSGSAKLIGVWSAINSAPTAAGAAMPASGFIKVRQLTGTYATSGALTGIGASANGAVVQGWIEFSADEAGTITLPRLGEWEARGAWFELGTTSGSRGQTFTLPTSGQANFWIPGVWIETAASSGVYEYWPALNVNAGGGWTTANQGTDARSRFVQVLATQIRIGSDGTNNIGELPGSGRKVVIPNIILVNNTTAARQTTAAPNATLGTRFETVTTSAGVLDLQYVACAWYLNIGQAYSLDFVNVATFDQILISEVAQPVNWNGGGVSIYGAGDQQALTLTSCLSGGTFTGAKFGRAGTIGSGDNSASINNCLGLTFNSCWWYQGTLRTNNTLGFGLAISQSDNLTFNDNVLCAGASLVTCKNNVWNDTIFYDRMVGATLTTFPAYAWALTTKCSDCLFDGLTFGGITNAHPYNGLLSVTNCDRIKLRNIGTAASPLSLGSSNAAGLILNDGGNCTDIELKRVYCDNARTNTIVGVNSTKGIVLENVWSDTAESIGTQSLDLIYKGCRHFGTPVSSFTSVYGTSFYDTFNATTTGKIGLFFNEPTSTYSAYYSGTNYKFTSTGSVYLGTSADTMTVEWPYYVLGYTGFSIVNPTLTGGTTVNERMDVSYQIDKNDGAGFSAWKNLRYPRAGGGGSGSSTTVTMTSTTGVAVNDYVFGTGIGTSARVTSIDSATDITVNVANSGAVSGVLVFSQLPFESSISATNGFKLKIRFTANATSVNNTINTFHLQGATDSSSQQTQYVLDYGTLELTGLQNPTEVRVYPAGSTTEIAGTGQESVTGGTFTAQIPATYTSLDISILSLGYQNIRLLALPFDADGVSAPIQQVIDRQYANPA